jgi:hypothetical protein
MATQRTSFAKLQRERDRQARATAKRDRRLRGPDEAEPTGLPETLPDTLSAAELLKLVEAVHKQFEAGEIDFDAFEEAKRDLLSRLPIE